MNIELITKLARGNTGGYILNSGKNKERELYILTENKDPEDPYISNKRHCIVIYNDTVKKLGHGSKEKIYVDAFYELDAMSWSAILDEYENRPPDRLKSFDNETEVKKYINHLIKREKERKKNILQYLNEKEEVKHILNPLLQLFTTLDIMESDLEVLEMSTYNGKALKSDSLRLIITIRKLSKRLGVSDTES